MEETRAIAVALLAASVLLGISAVVTRVATRTAVPVVLLFMGIGMLAGSEAVGGIYFHDYELALRIGLVALVLILFDGGLNTPASAARRHLGPAVTLATIGVLLTAGLVAVAARLFGFGWYPALLLGAVVSSTDAAAVFSVLRSSGLRLSQRLGLTLELESGMNDPMAVILTVALVEIGYGGGGASPLGLLWQVPVQLAVGGLVGVGTGLAGRWLLNRMPPFTGGLFPVLTIAFAFFAFGAATLVMGSGFLAVYAAGVVLGNGRLPNRSGMIRIHDFLAWISQVVMFLALGLLVFPSELAEVVVPGLVVAFFLVFVARPVAVALCLVPFRYSVREIGYVGWVGLRGAVPIILASFPILGGVPRGAEIFNIVFFVVVVSVLLQGMTTRWLTRRLKLEEELPPPPPAAVEINSVQAIDADLACYYIGAQSAVAGATIAELPFPEQASVVLVLRGTRLLPAKGPTRLAAGDHVYVFCLPEDEAMVNLLFGRRIEL